MMPPDAYRSFFIITELCPCGNFAPGKKRESIFLRSAEWTPAGKNAGCGIFMRKYGTENRQE
jgi:hypothetical protein